MTISVIKTAINMSPALKIKFNAVHWISYYPVDSEVSFGINAYLTGPEIS